VTVGLNHYLALAGLLFLTGVTGVLVRRNSLIVFMSIELMLSGANVVFAAFSRYRGDAAGQVFVLMSFAVAAAEAAIGLAILVEIHRLRRSVNVDDLKTLTE
jgi:NADH-quinone oxidoreductase subunit K